MGNENQTIYDHYKRMRRIKRRIRFILGTFSFSSVALVLGIISMLLLMIVGNTQSEAPIEGDGTVSGNVNLSPLVVLLQPIVEREAKAQGIPDMVPILLGIIQVESGGKLPDPMQSSESAGLPVGTLIDADASIKQGVKHFKAAVDQANQVGVDVWTAVQAYNFGTAYISYVAGHGKVTNTKIADDYSRTVVAPSLGNSTGITYSYPNPVAIPYNGGKLYLNGGNFFYDLLVKQYVQTGGGAAGGNGNNTATGWKKKAIENARSEMGQTFPTGWDAPGECIKAVQRWINNAGGHFGVGGVRSGYVNSGAKEVPWGQVQSGDVVQYENQTDPELFASGVHTMLVESVNKDGTINVVECNVPGGSGLVGSRSNLTNVAPAGWRTVVWRFPN
ncbi:lysozyme family protein [Enterococcus faecalis]